MPGDQEYQSLRAEILAVSGWQLTLLTFSFSVSAALLGWGMTRGENRSLIVLTPLIVLYFAGSQLVSHAYSIMRLASYIRCVIEPTRGDLSWESSMYAVREELENKPQEYPLLVGFSWPAYEYLLMVVGWLCIGLAAVLAVEDDVQVSIGIVIGMAAVIWLWFSWWLHRRMGAATQGDLDDELEKLWGAVVLRKVRNNK